jgi:hypothetical protein
VDQREDRQGRAVIVAVTVWGAAIACFGLAHWLPLALALLAAAGWADVLSAVFRGTIIQLAKPDALRGRLMGASPEQPGPVDLPGAAGGRPAQFAHPPLLGQGQGEAGEHACLRPVGMGGHDPDDPDGADPVGREPSRYREQQGSAVGFPGSGRRDGEVVDQRFRAVALADDEAVRGKQRYGRGQEDLTAQEPLVQARSVFGGPPERVVGVDLALPLNESRRPADVADRHLSNHRATITRPLSAASLTERTGVRAHKLTLTCKDPMYVQ